MEQAELIAESLIDLQNIALELEKAVYREEINEENYVELLDKINRAKDLLTQKLGG